jgi:hypothetical protein
MVITLAFLPHFLSAEEQLIGIKVDIYKSTYNKSVGMIEALKNAELTGQPHLIGNNHQPSRIEIGIEFVEMLSVTIEPNKETNRYDVKLKLGHQSDNGQWQESITSSVENEHNSPLMFTSVLGEKLYIININTQLFSSKDAASTWVNLK